MKIIYADARSKIYLGNNFSKDLGKIIQSNKFPNKSAVLITGIKSFTSSNYFTQLKMLFLQNAITVARHIKVKPNPSELSISTQFPTAKLQFDLVFAVGGGSVIDVAKLVKHKYMNSAKLVVIYTLPGSAALVTPFAIVNNNEFKIGLSSDDFVPKISYINKEIINSISTKRRLIAIADIFSHAVESLYSTASDRSSRESSRKSLEILLDGKVGRLGCADLLIADIHAGLAEKVGLVLFPHAAGHYLTFNLSIPHSVATMYFLPQYLHLIKKNGVGVESRYIQYAEHLQKIFEKNKLMRKIILTHSQVDELFILTQKYMSFVYTNSPVILEREKYKSILETYVEK